MPSWTVRPKIAQGQSRFARPAVTLERTEPCAKLLLLGDAPALMQALPWVGIPLQPNAVVRTGDLGTCLWLRPTQRLLLISSAGGARAEEIRSLSAPDAWALDVGARYVDFAVTGRGADAVLNAACSLDLRESAFPVDTCAQTRFDRCAVILLRASPERFEILTERPLAAHLWLWLRGAADNV
jgi:sarcosine oxidase, subunit gamma